jgi:hypothetical protein
MSEKNWMVAFGQQLSLDFPEVQVHSRPDDAAVEFARVQHAKTLLRELAKALGEQRAVTDLEAYRSAITMRSDRE